MKLWIKILIAMVLGVLCGAIIGPYAEYVKPIGTLFLGLISMVVMPLVLSSMIVGITSIHDPQKLGRIGLKSMLLYISTMLIAMALGIAAAMIFTPGEGLSFDNLNSKSFTTETPIEHHPPLLSEMLLSLVPVNPFNSLAEGNVLQIIVFAIFLGIAINFAGEKGKPLLHVFEALADVMYRLTAVVMEFSPYGIFAIMTWVSGSFGIAILLPLVKFLILYYSVCLLHIGVVFGGILWGLARLHPKPFFRGMSDAMMMAFSTCSSSATLPVSMHCVQDNLGVSKNITNFMMPLGATINTNGAAIFQGMSTIFVAQVYGIPLDITSIITIVFSATMATIGAVGIPGTGFIMLTVVFNAVGLPIEGLALLAGIDRIREMGSTVLNVLGDAVCAVYVAKQENELDERQYYHEEPILVE